MDYILIKGSMDAGKSTTIANVCKKLNPEKIFKLIINKDETGELKELSKTVEHVSLHNDTYLISVKNKTILIVAGSPTEQKHTITKIITITQTLKIEIDFAIIAMRSFELKDGYNTPKELLNFGNCLLSLKIFRIQSENFRDSQEWKKRIEDIVNITLKNI